MAAFSKFNAFVANIANGGFNLGSDGVKVMLTNSAPAAGNAVKSDITDLSTSGGYTAGGAAVTISSSTQSGGLYKLIGSLPSPTWTGSGGGFGPFRYAVVYDSTTNNLIGWWDYGSALSVNAGDTFTVTLDATNGIVQLT
jgi:hypothetical protein